jgi:predicted metal-binding membrane protein
VSTAATSLRLSTFRRISWPRPEWWTLCLCIGAWLLIFSRAGAGLSSHGHLHHEAASVRTIDTFSVFPAQMFWWLVMVVAMMFPLLIAHVRNTAARSLWRRRHQAIGGFLAGYLAPWFIFGTVTTAAQLLFPFKNSAPISAAGFVVAAIWQVLPVRRRSVLACHRTRPLAPRGWRADRDCLLYGWMVGTWCVGSCWAVMLACLMSAHSLPAMIGLTGIGLWERTKPRRNQIIPCVILVLLLIAHQ